MRAHDFRSWAAVSAFLLTCIAQAASRDQVLFDEYKQFVERENGMSCDELNDRVMRFVESAIKPIVLAGREGKDWVAMVDAGTLKALRSYKEPTFRCHLVQANARRLGFPMRGDFDTLQQLVSALDTFITYSGDPPSAKGLKPGAFERVDKLYRNLTLASSPTSGQPSRP